MRDLSTVLEQAQRACDPYASVSVVQELRGWGPDTDSLCWAKLVADDGGTPKFVAAATRSDGQVLRFVNTGLVVNQQRIADPTAAANWSTPTATTEIISSAVGSIAATTDGDEIRLFYADSTTIKYIASTDDGATWGSAVTVASSLAAQPIDLHAAHYPSWTHGDWVVGCSIDTGSGVFRARFFYWDGSAWQTTELALDNWRMAGLGENTSSTVVVMYAFDSDGAGTTRLAMGLAQPAWSLTRVYQDRTHGGLFGLNCLWYYISALAGGYMCAVGEHGYDGGGGGATLGALFDTGYQLTEPVHLPGIDSTTGGAYVAFVTAGGRSYVVQDVGVYEGVPRTVSGEAIIPIKYSYDEGKIELEFAGDVETIEIGNLLAITRTLEYLGQSDSETFRVLVTAVDAGWDKVRVTGYDALGYLGVFRARRGMVLMPNRSGWAETFYVIEGICGRAGIKLYADYDYISIVESLNFSLKPGESLAGALYRAGSQHRVFLVPRNDGTFALTAIPAGYDQGDSDNLSASGNYETSFYNYGPDDHPLANVHSLSDALRPAAVYVLGMASTDPEDGSRVGHGLGPWSGCVRPAPISISNRYLNSGTKIDRTVESETRRQEMEGVDAILESVANLGLELYDRIKVSDSRHGWTEKQFRVRRIRERWEQGRLTQTVYLGDMAYESSS